MAACCTMCCGPWPRPEPTPGHRVERAPPGALFRAVPARDIPPPQPFQGLARPSSRSVNTSSPCTPSGREAAGAGARAGVCRPDVLRGAALTRRTPRSGSHRETGRRPAPLARNRHQGPRGQRARGSPERMSIFGRRASPAGPASAAPVPQLRFRRKSGRCPGGQRGATGGPLWRRAKPSGAAAAPLPSRMAKARSAGPARGGLLRAIALPVPGLSGVRRLGPGKTLQPARQGEPPAARSRTGAGAAARPQPARPCACRAARGTDHGRDAPRDTHGPGRPRGARAGHSRQSAPGKAATGDPAEPDAAMPPRRRRRPAPCDRRRTAPCPPAPIPGQDRRPIRTLRVPPPPPLDTGHSSAKAAFPVIPGMALLPFTLRKYPPGGAGGGKPPACTAGRPAPRRRTSPRRPCPDRLEILRGRPTLQAGCNRGSSAKRVCATSAMAPAARVGSKIRFQLWRDTAEGSTTKPWAASSASP